MNKQKNIMKNLFLTITLFLISFITCNAQETYNLTVHFIGMESDNGAVFSGLYNTESSFLKTNYKGDIVKITNKKATVIFNSIPKGTYAVSAFHDENDNKKMDTNFIGIPKEPIGVSNDATGFMGPPKYNDAKFPIHQNTTITIRIK